MKKSILAFFMCIIILVFNLCSCGSLVKNPSYNPEECTTLHLSPTVCEATFNKTTPKEFCKNKGKGTYIYENYISAKVDDDGCLILIVKNDVISAWKNSLYPMQVLQCVLGDSRDIGVVVDYSKESELSGFMNFSFMKGAGDCGLEISDDFTKVIARPGSDKTYAMFVMPSCILVQMFEGKTCKETRVEFIELDKNGEITNRTVLPDAWEDAWKE